MRTPQEQQAQVRFDTACLGARFADVTRWACRHELTRGLQLGYFGSCTGAAAALRAAGECPDVVRAVVCRAGRFDLAPAALARVRAPTLPLAGESDNALLQLSEQALSGITAPKMLQLLPGGSLLPPHLGTLEQVAQLSVDSFQRHTRAG